MYILNIMTMFLFSWLCEIALFSILFSEGVRWFDFFGSWVFLEFLSTNGKLDRTKRCSKKGTELDLLLALHLSFPVSVCYEFSAVVFFWNIHNNTTHNVLKKSHTQETAKAKTSILSVGVNSLLSSFFFFFLNICFHITYYTYMELLQTVNIFQGSCNTEAVT